METKADWHRNPECPTMLGWHCKTFDNNSGVVLERNPYYWCVMPNGDQLPYLDEIRFTLISDPQAGLLQVQQGSVDYCHGPFNQIALTDVETLRSGATEAGAEVPAGRIARVQPGRGPQGGLFQHRRTDHGNP
ncbi:ABC-type transport system substrate-binding protein [Microlunatus parietis]|uniref:ABC-type transport system substrate-binding protein n=2 Tax=Microlunatus parietis TaxID=682979 RepID=A0A7Y9I3P3_9ACTN|nr:ABC-type transport system substrate-binding protein [Microlunatus parietis]